MGTRTISSTSQPRRPSAARLEHALVASAAWHCAESTEELAALVCSSLRRLIPCDAAGWNEIDLDGCVVRAHTEPELDFPREELDRLVTTHPLLQHVLDTRNVAARTISDELEPEAFHRTRLYRQVYAPMGVEDQLVAAVEVDGPRVVAVALNRGERSFTDDDRVMLDLLRPHLVAAHERVTRRVEAETRLVFAVDPDRARAAGLTARETEVIVLAGRGLTNHAIGECLGISARTVHKHLENLYGKLGVGTRAAAVAELAQRGTSG